MKFLFAKFGLARNLAVRMVIILNKDRALRSKLISHGAVTTIWTDVVPIDRLNDPETNMCINIMLTTLGFATYH